MRHYGCYWRRFATIVIASVVATVAEAIVLIVIVLLATQLARAGSGAINAPVAIAGRSVSFGVAATLGVLAAITRMAGHFVIAKLTSRLVSSYELSKKQELYRVFTEAPLEVQLGQSIGGFQNFLATDVEESRYALESLCRGVLGVIGLTALVVAAIVADPNAAVMLVVVGGALVLLFRPLSRRAAEHARTRATEMTTWAGSLAETLGASREIRVFGVEDHFESELQRSLHNAVAARAKSDVLSSVMPALYQSLVLLMTLLGLVVISLLSPGSVAGAAPVALLLLRALSYSQITQNTYHGLVERSPYIVRIDEMISTLGATREPFGDERLDVLDSIEFTSVSFQYRTADRPAIADFSLKITAGEIVGVVGPSGSGKSTICMLALRLLTPSAGEVTINGIALKHISSEDWSKVVAYVPQDPLLVSGSIGENIRFGRPLNDDAIEEAAKRADIHEYIVSLPHGYDTLLGARGTGLSGGQRQRLCIARALAADPQFIVFDEATSSLDATSERMVAETVAALRGRVTCLVVTHRPALATICDQTVEVAAPIAPDTSAAARTSPTSAFGT